jgi:hypothetical protein
VDGSPTIEWNGPLLLSIYLNLLSVFDIGYGQDDGEGLQRRRAQVFEALLEFEVWHFTFQAPMGPQLFVYAYATAFNRSLSDCLVNNGTFTSSNIFTRYVRWRALCDCEICF